MGEKKASTVLARVPRWVQSRRERGGITHSELITRSKSLIYRSVKEEGSGGSGALYGINGQKVVRSLAGSSVRSDLNGERDGVVAGANFFRDAPLRFAENHFIIPMRVSGFGTEERRGTRVPSSNLDRSVFIPAGFVSGVLLLLGGKTPVAPSLPLPPSPSGAQYPRRRTRW